MTFQGAEVGAMGAIMDPRSRRQSRLARELGAEAMPPLWQYLFSP
jgi:diphthamide synthase (EF-2-diphthine--ammonia ligase)